MYEASELILNEDGSVFHLHLLPHQISDKIILVGDQERVALVASFFDQIEFEVQNREFKTITGYFQSKRITVISTGIGTDNIDIVINELDALVNIDLKLRKNKDAVRKLSFVRIGTSGGLQEFTPEGSFVASRLSIGFDGLLNYYPRRDEVCDLNFEDSFVTQTNYDKRLAAPYCVHSSSNLLAQIAHSEVILGNTISAPGFYAPQGRSLRLGLANVNLNSKIVNFEYKGEKVTNFEMESSAIAGLSLLMGHEAITLCLIIANRYGKAFIGNYQDKMKELILLVLKRF